MCNPIALAVASFAVSAASTVAEYQAQSAAAEEQNRLYEANRRNAIRAFEDKQLAMNQRIAQEQEAAATEKFDTALEARAARATNEVAAGESGIAGNTVEGLARDFASREQRFKDRIDQQTDWTVTQLAAEKRGQSFEALDRINSVRRATKPNFAAAGLKIAAAGIDSFSSYKKSTGGW